MADQGRGGLLSPFLRTRRIAAARPFLKGRILDVGCGTGKLASLVRADSYVGFDIDEFSLNAARTAHPGHHFVSALPPAGQVFDSVVALAFIEHVADPATVLKELAARLGDTPESQIICTTPHPSMETIHAAGARLGLFSREANEEHETLLDRKRLEEITRTAGLRLVVYRRFLLGVNQLALFRRDARGIGESPEV